MNNEISESRSDGCHNHQRFYEEPLIVMPWQKKGEALFPLGYISAYALDFLSDVITKKCVTTYDQRL